MRLSHSDFDALQRSILELYAHRDLDAFRQAVPALFLAVVPADYFGLHEIDVDVNRRRTTIVASWESAPRVGRGEVREQAERHGFDHPFTRHALQSGDPSALKLSDFYSRDQFLNSELFDEVYRGASIERLVAAGSFGGGVMSTLNFARGPRERDFTERDRLVLNLLRPHFEQARRNAAWITSLLGNGGGPIEAYGFTPREHEIARWVARAKTNPEIALILRMRVRTIEKHVERILRKMGVENRTAAAVLLTGPTRA